MYLGLRIVAGALVASALTFLVSGSHAALLETRVMFFAWGLFLGNAGIVLAGCLHLGSVMREESDRETRRLAEAVGTAVGEVLDAAPDDVVRLPPTRRGI